jgi:hypothetical protein
MSEDRLVRELGHLANEEEGAGKARFDERWDRLSQGQLSAAEEAELLALAETSEEGREAWEAFRPLGPDFQAGVVRALREQGLAPAPPLAKVLPFRRRAVFAGSLAAAAAAVAVVVLVARPPAPLAEYASLDLSGGTHAMRGEEPATAEPDFAPGDRFEATLRVRTQGTYERHLEARSYLACGREVRPLEVRSQVEPGGAVRMWGSIGDVLPGVCTLWAVVGRQGALPAAAELRSLATGAAVRRRDWVALPEKVRIQPRSP